MEKYIPDIYQKSIYAIDYNKLQKSGIKCLLFDLDNTLISPDLKEASAKLLDLFASLQKNKFKIMIFTTSSHHRARAFGEQLGVEFHSNHFKTYPKRLKALLKHNRLDESEVALIGDQIITDIVGGNEAGITTILVNPISTKEPLLPTIYRLIEKRVMASLDEAELFTKGKYYE